MFNVLPDNLKDNIKSEYRTRFFIVTFFLVILLQIMLLFFLLPSAVLSYYKKQSLLIDVQNVLHSPALNHGQTVSNTVSSTNDMLKIINSTFAYPHVVPYIDTVLAYKTQGIHIGEFLYTVTGASTATVAIQGVSDTRATLVAFVKKLQASGSFKNVDLPVSNLAKDTDIIFSLNIAVASSTTK